MRMLTGVLLAVLLAALLVSGCVAPADQPGSTGIAVLLDLTGSTTAVRERYLADFARVLDGSRDGDHLYVLPISAASLVEPVAVDITFPRASWLENRVFKARRLSAAKSDALSRVEALLKSPSTDRRAGSAIIDGLERAADLLQPYGQRYVVVISDMIEQSELADFSVLNADMDAVLVSVRERAAGLGAQVYIAGVTNGAGEQPLTSARVREIRAFWTSFLAERDCALEAYGPDLTAFRSGP
ncbi:MAG: hypothetical protein ACYC6V_08040 [Bacillota bacterium]